MCDECLLSQQGSWLLGCVCLCVCVSVCVRVCVRWVARRVCVRGGTRCQEGQKMSWNREGWEMVRKSVTGKSAGSVFVLTILCHSCPFSDFSNWLFLHSRERQRGYDGEASKWFWNSLWVSLYSNSCTPLPSDPPGFLAGLLIDCNPLLSNYIWKSHVNIIC